LRHNARSEEGGSDVHKKYRDALSRGAGGHEVDQGGDLPSYIVPGTPEEANWRRRHPHGEVCFDCLASDFMPRWGTYYHCHLFKRDRSVILSLRDPLQRILQHRRVI